MGVNQTHAINRSITHAINRPEYMESVEFAVSEIHSRQLHGSEKERNKNTNMKRTKNNLINACYNNCLGWNFVQHIA